MKYWGQATWKPYFGISGCTVLQFPSLALNPSLFCVTENTMWYEHTFFTINLLRIFWQEGCHYRITMSDSVSYILLLSSWSWLCGPANWTIICVPRQNHRVLWSSLLLITWLSMKSDQAVQCHIQLGHENLQGRELYNFTGQTASDLTVLTVKLCSLSLILLPCITGCIFSITSSLEACYLVSRKPSFTQAEQTHPSQLQRSKM